MEFEYIEKYGIFSEKYRLIPAPNFMMRRSAILDAINNLKPGKIIEIGFGTGVCTFEFHRKGFDCTGYDIEPKSVEMANSIFNSQETRIIDFRGQLNDNDLEIYDYLAAFEVLEHIKDEVEIIHYWKNYIKKEGRIILSVPAKMKYCSYLDRVSGHVKRYEKNELVKLLADNGFKIETLYCYGFPLSNIISKPINYLYRRPQYNRVKGTSELERTKASGYLRLKDYKYKSIIPFSVIYFFTRLQRYFYHTDLGLGYVVVARKVK